MPLAGITKNEQDIRKIHNEIGQIVHRKMANTTFAITLLGAFGVFGPARVITIGSDLAFLFALSILLTFLLFLLYQYNHWLDGMLRIFTTYLRVTGHSAWEDDWAKYRKQKDEHGHWGYFGYTKAQTLVFLVLILVSIFWPIIIFWFSYPKIEPTWFLVFMLALNFMLGVFYLLRIWQMGFGKEAEHFENKAMEIWKSL